VEEGERIVAAAALHQGELNHMTYFGD